MKHSRGKKMPQQDPPIAITRKSKITSQGNSNFIKNPPKLQPLSFFMDDSGIIDRGQHER